MAKITRDNFDGQLKLSDNPRGSNPNGNIYYADDRDRVQVITREELAQVDFGSGLVDNPITNADKIQLLAIYKFFQKEANTLANLQNFKFPFDAVPNEMGRLVGAGSCLSGIKFDSGSVDANGEGGSLGDDRLKLADTGMTEYAADGNGQTVIDRKQHGAKNTNPINSTSQAGYQLVDSISEADRMAAPVVDFANQGDFDQLIQTLGTTANGDTNAGDFDLENKILILSVRDYGFTMGEVISADLGVVKLGTYSQGYPLGNNLVQAVADIPEANVFGGSAISPYTGVNFFRHATPQTRTGFEEADGAFTDEITNDNGASLIQVRARCDKIMDQDTDQNQNTANTGAFIPRRVAPLYTVENGKIRFRQGIFVPNLPTADQQSVEFVDDNGDIKTYPSFTGLVIPLSTVWFDDSAQDGRLQFVTTTAGNDFDTENSITVEDANGTPIAFNSSDSRIVAVTGGYELRAPYAYGTNNQGGLTPNTDREVVLVVGGADQAKRKEVYQTITNATTVTIDGRVEAETN